MKEYPSIPSSLGMNFREISLAYIFDKLDGSSCRSEWSKKSGWTKHGRRNGLMDDSNPHLVVVPNLFMTTLSEPLTKLLVDNKIQHAVVFYEFWGDKSIAGLHYDDDPKRLTVFDIAVNKQGILGPKEFRKLLEGKVSTPKFLGIQNWTKGLVQLVRTGLVEGVTFEGVVAKAGIKHDIVRSKAKTQQWIDKVKQIHGNMAEKIITS